MTLLELVQQVCDELMISRPTVVVSSQDPQVRQLYALLNRLGVDIARQYPWQRLNAEHLLTTVSLPITGDTTTGSAVITNIADTTGITTQFEVTGEGVPPFARVVSVGASTVTLNMEATDTGAGVAFEFGQVEYDLPTDWLHQIPQTEWDRTNRWPLLGPQSSQDWQSFKSGIVYSGPRQRFRIQGNTINISPQPPADLLFSYLYISKNWVQSSGGAGQSKYLADSDTAIFPDSLLITGLKTQWKAAKGLDGNFDRAEFVSLLEVMKAQDQSSPRLSLSPFDGTVLLTTANIADSGYGA